MLEVIINGERYVKESEILVESVLTAEERSLMELLMNIPKYAIKINSNEKAFLRVIGEDTPEGKKVFAERFYNIINYEVSNIHYGVLQDEYRNKTISPVLEAGMLVTQHVYFKGIFMSLPKKGDPFDAEKVCVAGSGVYGIYFPREVDIVLFPGVEGTKKRTLCL